MKIYEKIVKFIKEYYKILILYVCLFLFFTLKLPYYIESPGGLIDISKKIIVSDSYKFSGSLNMAYVSEMHATIPTFLFSKINIDWNLIKQQEMTSSNEKIEDLEYRNKMFLRESYDVAKLVAYNHSKIDYEVKNRKVYVTYIDEKSKTDLKIGDQIIEVDEKKVLDKNHLQAYIASKNINDEVVFTVNRKNKMLKVKTNLIDVNGEPKVGAIITEDFDILSSKKMQFKFNDSESGPSGGLMLTLAMYSYINEVDITGGKKIAGTGTINLDGTVGEISGVKYKLIGAAKNKADVFIVPEGDNYKEAKKIKQEKNYDIELVSVESFEEALKYLKDR